MTRAVCFRVSQRWVRCLRVLLAHGVEVPFVVTHEDAPGESIWFDSVKAQPPSTHSGATPADPNAADIVAQIAEFRPDFLFSFYYRLMLKAPLLAQARHGALNMHGSLLPNYRGRVPVNWAIIRGETETGATLHYMTETPDNGDIVAQSAVPILPDDTAKEVLDKVTVAAELTLDRVVPALVAGTADRRPQDLSRGGYFSGRKPRMASSIGRGAPWKSTTSCALSRRRIPARAPRCVADPHASCARAYSTRRYPRKRRRRSAWKAIASLLIVEPAARCSFWRWRSKATLFAPMRLRVFWVARLCHWSRERVCALAGLRSRG